MEGTKIRTLLVQRVYNLQSYKMGKTGEINEASYAHRYTCIFVFEALNPKRHANA